MATPLKRPPEGPGAIFGTNSYLLNCHHDGYSFDETPEGLATIFGAPEGLKPPMQTKRRSISFRKCKKLQLGFAKICTRLADDRQAIAHLGEGLFESWSGSKFALTDLTLRAGVGRE